MKLWNAAIERLGQWLITRAMQRDADFVIGGKHDPYIIRWWLTPWSRLYRGMRDEDRTRWQTFVACLPGAYLHWILRSDDDRALHDHPWSNVSILLAGSYIEHTIAAGGVHHRTRIRAGDIVVRRALAAHRLEVDEGACWSLFLTGFRLRDWGFHCPNGWVPWRKFTNPADGGATIGAGCDA
jgi:hypothetical protein